MVTSNVTTGTFLNHTHVRHHEHNDAVLCYAPRLITSNGLLFGDNPLDFTLPLLILQITIVVVVTRLLYFIIKPLRQPRFIAEVMGGLILGPSVLGRIPHYFDFVFPKKTISNFETMAHIGIVFFMFLEGLEMNIGSVRLSGRQAWVVASSGMVLPFIIEVIVFFAFGKDIRRMSNDVAYLIFLAVSLSITSFSVLARVLAQLKMLNGDTGHLAMSAALITDALAWILLAIAISLTDRDGNLVSAVPSIDVIASGVALLLAIYFTVLPAAGWITKRTPEGEPVNPTHLIFAIVAMMAAAILAEFIGIHAVFGAFVAGLAIPDGILATTLVEKLEDFVTGLLLPLYFASNGKKINLTSIRKPGISGFLTIVITLSTLARTGVTMLVSTTFFGFSANQGLLLGIFMNTKGILEMVVLRIGLDKSVLDTESYSMMVLMSVILTVLVTPLSTIVSSTRQNFINYKRRMLQRLKQDSELRVLACIYTSRDVSSFVNLLSVSHPSKISPILVCAVHLMELTARESAMLVVQDRHRLNNRFNRGSSQNRGNYKNTHGQSDQILSALYNYEQSEAGASVFPMTVVSPYSTMHDDIIRVAEDKHTALIILPFHKQKAVDGGMEVVNERVQTVNQNILANPPCSVAIFIDKHLGITGSLGDWTGKYNVVLIFIGGQDDREALAYGSRVALNSGVDLSILHFVEVGTPPMASPSPSAPKGISRQDTADRTKLAIMTEKEREHHLDETAIKDIRLRYMGNSSVVYQEETVKNGEEMMEVLRSKIGTYDLCVVGMGKEVGSKLMAGLTDWNECPELGPLGDVLVSSDFSSTVSVLVIQQYKGGDDVPPVLPRNQSLAA